MNCLTLRISSSSGDKSKNSIGFSPITIPDSLFEDTDEKYTHIREFMNSTSTDGQLTILKNLLDTNKTLVDDIFIKFLVIVFWQAEAKHPVKCFISRHISKIQELQQPFTNVLSDHIADKIKTVPIEYRPFIDIVNRVVTCYENFQPGIAAVKIVEIPLAGYMKQCLECSVKTLRETSLSPTEKNEIFNLAHKTIRVLFHILHSAGEDNVKKLITLFDTLRLFIQDLMFDEDVPMDTKSLCGLLYLSMYKLEYGADSWIDILNPSEAKGALLNLLSVDAARLSLLSAIVTVGNVDQLTTQTVELIPAIIILTQEILTVGERNFSESVIFLGVSRTLLQISKLLNKIEDRATGLVIVDYLLRFAWSHLEHYMDSVRHQTGQMLGCVVMYAAKLEREGEPTALNKITSALSSMERSRRSYYQCVCSLSAALGARRVLHSVLQLQHVLLATQHQAVQATASAALTMLLEKFCAGSTTEEVNTVWVQPIIQHVRGGGLDSGALGVMEGLLIRASNLHPALEKYIMPYIKETSESSSKKRDMKCTLMLLRVARRSGMTERLDNTNPDLWKGIISYDVLEQAAVDAVDEIRFLSLSLIVESPRTTEIFSEKDLQFVLYYLKYNINAQSPNFRQLTLSAINKFIKRLEDSYKVIIRQKSPEGDYYHRFMDEFRALCFDSLLPGANYSRRYVALNTLAWCQQIALPGYTMSWKSEYVERLLLHLEDSFEANKTLALEVLHSCPDKLLKGENYSISLKLEDIVRQASSLNPTDCTSAAYKLHFVADRLPDYILNGEQLSVMHPVRFTLLTQLLSHVGRELSVCEQSIVRAAGRAPVYGLLHCVRHTLRHVDMMSISQSTEWKNLIGDIITTCISVNAAVSCVVNNSSPEGHLPMDMSPQITDHGNSGNITLEDGRLVTAQMVLLCAWRCVKEVSLLLGALCSSCSISGETCASGIVSVTQVTRVGEHFTSLLADTKHRGAFEQAYVGFTQLLARLWRCRSNSLHSLPREWLTQLMSAIADEDNQGALCATRRSAGIPFMIQALVSTELQVRGNPSCFHWCMHRLLSLSHSRSEQCRTHSLNILRALFRAHALDDAVGGYVGDGLMCALRGFDGDTWAERNSSTLLFSALMVRIFGVQRTRDTDHLCVRNRMTGRIFFLRYPQLYDFMLEKLREVSESTDAQLLRPSLYPILLLLARLYPSSLEGTVSNLKLVAFVPYVLSCAKSSVMKTRQLAAKAIVPLISPEHYVRHIQCMFLLLHDVHIQRNYCHGILLQLDRLLSAKPQDLPGCTHHLHGCLEGSLWILRQATGNNPCYVIADELFKVINALVSKFPALPLETVTEILKYLNILVFNTTPPNARPGRDICLANAANLYINLATDEQKCTFIYKALEHTSYEVIISILDYLLFLQNHQHAKTHKNVLENVRKNKNYIPLLCKVTKSGYLEAQKKSLKLLCRDGNAEKYIIEDATQEITDEAIIEKLFENIKNANETLTPIYLEILLNFVTDKLKDSSLSVVVLLNIVRVVFEYSSSDNCDHTRTVVAIFIERNIAQLLKMDFSGLSEADRFELQATLWATIITLVDDQEHAIRQRVSDVMSDICGAHTVTPYVCGTLLTRYLQPHCGLYTVGILTVIALLDFRSVVVITDDGTDECRVFDQNEKYNVFLEETVWTKECAEIITNKYKMNQVDLVNIIDDPVYKNSFDALCNDNVDMFKKLVAGTQLERNDAVNPKIKLFVEKLSSASGGNE